MKTVKTDAQKKLARKQAGAKALTWAAQGLRLAGQAINWTADGLADLSEKGARQLKDSKESTPKNG